MKNYRVKGTATTPKKIVIFEKLNNGEINTYSEVGYKIITQEQYSQIRSNPLTSEYLLVKKNERQDDVKDLSLRKQYKLFIKEAYLLNELTNGEIDLYKTGSVAKTALQYFFNFHPITPQPIEKYEWDIYDQCCNNAIIWAKPFKGKGFKYDIVSQFPSILMSTGFQIPTTKGKLETITIQDFKNKKFFSYGIYHVHIDIKDSRLIIPSEQDWYVHTDLNRAMELKYKLTLIEDDEPNALLYDKFINGHKLFRPFIEGLFCYKQKGFACIKKYINSLWGALCMKDKLTLFLSDKNDYIDRNKWESKTWTPIQNGCKVELINKIKRYEYDFARIQPFLWAKSRYMLSKILEKNIDNVVFAHTDGLILTEEIKDTKLGTNLGELRFEGVDENCQVVNCTGYRFGEKKTNDPFEQIKSQIKLLKKCQKSTIKEG